MEVFFSAGSLLGPVELTLKELDGYENKRPEFHWGYNTEANWSDQLDAVLRIAFAFMIHTSIPTLMSDMKEPK